MWLAGDGFALLLSLAAGLCTGIGGLAAVFAREKGRLVLPFSLGFAAGVMVMVSLADILPEAAAFISRRVQNPFAGIYALFAMLGGMLLAAVGSRVLPEDAVWLSGGSGGDRSIARVGIMTMAAVMAHNVPEGIATFMAGCGERSLGISVAFAIALHNIPEGITVAIPVYYATGSRGKGFFCALVSGLGEPLGALLAVWLLRPFLTELSLGVILGMVAGIMLYLSFDELIPAALRCHEKAPLAGILSGIVVMGAGLSFFG
ncbi:MAG: zinc transporter ZupT [Acetanaerobacterium sp.]